MRLTWFFVSTLTISKGVDTPLTTFKVETRIGFWSYGSLEIGKKNQVI